MSLKDAHTVVIKVGSALLVGDDDRTLNESWLASLCEDVHFLMEQGKKVVIVSSGSVALGRDILGPDVHPPLTLRERQAAAACGQMALMTAYSEYCQDHGHNIAQILLDINDSDDRKRYLNARATLMELLKRKIIPIINENDTIATKELRFGDNDRLAARVSQMVEADALILLSDVDGLYEADPRVKPDAKHIPEVDEITSSIEAMAGKPRTDVGSGGMETKIIAANIAADVGCSTYITLGKVNNPVQALLNGAKATHFKANRTPHNAREHWIIHQLNDSGFIVVDNGAFAALKKGNSLLPAGIVKVEGEFSKRDAVTIKLENGEEVARGIVGYHSYEVDQVKGKKTHELPSILGYDGRHTVIHQDDMVIL